jgi:alcohol dehydrogenase
MQRKVWSVRKTGSLTNLREEVEILDLPQENQVQIEVSAIGFNFADIFAIFGIYSATPSVPFVPGLEFSGRIIRCGDKVRDLQVGDEVMGVTRFGGYASHLNIDSRYVFLKPKAWSFMESAGFLVQALTAYYALVPLGNLQPSQHVLIHSAAGGVGIYANRFAKELGGITIGTIGNENKIQVLIEEGYDYYVVRNKEWIQELEKKLNGKPISLVLECIGGRVLTDSYALMAPSGRLVTYGSANFMPQSNQLSLIQTGWNYIFRPKLDPLKMISDNKSVMGFNLIWLWDQVDKMQNYVQQIMNWNPKAQRIGRIYEWDDTPKALQEFQSGKTIGKVIITL